ncbi:unnamed protein product [Prorocentrum cordatum]|uniref:Integrase catalytic domain-containing protein n=1 Tax=Prorocentrum cordatum TaxID=2364126 RepID=A0ABN9VJV0_9DINO|nr:unnamed protein product [Polarella glacialis]
MTRLAKARTCDVSFITHDGATTTVTDISWSATWKYVESRVQDASRLIVKNTFLDVPEDAARPPRRSASVPARGGRDADDPMAGGLAPGQASPRPEERTPSGRAYPISRASHSRLVKELTHINSTLTPARGYAQMPVGNSSFKTKSVNWQVPPRAAVAWRTVSRHQVYDNPTDIENLDSIVKDFARPGFCEPARAPPWRRSAVRRSKTDRGSHSASERQAAVHAAESTQAIERISIAVKKQREKFVKKREKTIVFGVGNDRDWRDAEADEAVFGRAAKADDPESVEWEQWAGIVERGRPESLVLAKTTAAPTVKRAPGPGAIRKVDWAPLANRYLKGRRIILHTDRAKSYAMRVEGVLHDSVRHCKKRVNKNGKWVWMKPCYARLATHKLPCGRKLRTKAGSQVIDSAWKYIRSTLGGQTMVPNSETAATAIRSAQWLYWHRGKDLWAEMGSTFCANFWRR